MAKSTQTTFSYEFGGPIGALATMLLLPVVIVLLILWSDLGHITFDKKSLHSIFVSLGGEDIEMYWTCVKVLGGWLSGTGTFDASVTRAETTALNCRFEFPGFLCR